MEFASVVLDVYVGGAWQATTPVMARTFVQNVGGTEGRRPDEESSGLKHLK